MELTGFYKDDYMVTQLTSIYNIQWSRRQDSLQPTGHGWGSVKPVTILQRNTSVATKEFEDNSPTRSSQPLPRTEDTSLAPPPSPSAQPWTPKKQWVRHDITG